MNVVLASAAGCGRAADSGAIHFETRLLFYSTADTVLSNPLTCPVLARIDLRVIDDPASNVWVDTIAVAVVRQRVSGVQIAEYPRAANRLIAPCDSEPERNFTARCVTPNRVGDTRHRVRVVVRLTGLLGNIRLALSRDEIAGSHVVNRINSLRFKPGLAFGEASFVKADRYVLSLVWRKESRVGCIPGVSNIDHTVEAQPDSTKLGSEYISCPTVYNFIYSVPVQAALCDLQLIICWIELLQGVRMAERQEILKDYYPFLMRVCAVIEWRIDDHVPI